MKTFTIRWALGLIMPLLMLAMPASAIEHNIPLVQSAGGTLYLDETIESKLKASFVRYWVELTHVEPSHF